MNTRNEEYKLFAHSSLLVPRNRIMPIRTPLFETQHALGARLIEFGGWDMPVQYSGILAEHHAVRSKAGLFDLSHMGEIEVSGPQALDALQELVVTDVARVQL